MWTADRLNDASDSQSANVKITARTFKKSDGDERQNPTGERIIEEQIEFPAEALVEANRSESKNIVIPARQAQQTRYISAATRLGIWLRDEGRCTYMDPATKERCIGTYGLEVDHIEGFAFGGVNDLRNLRLRCHAHNLLHAVHTYGREKMDTFVNPNY